MFTLSPFAFPYVFLKAESGIEAIAGGFASGLILYLVVSLINRSKRNLQEKKYSNGLKTAQLVSQINENDSEAIFTIAKDYYNNANYDEALRLFRKCLASNPDKVECLMYLGLIYHLRNDYSNVIYTHEQFAEKLERSNDYWSRLEFIRKNYTKILALFFYCYGFANQKHGHITKAERAKKTAINLDSTLSNNDLY